MGVIFSVIGLGTNDLSLGLDAAESGYNLGKGNTDYDSALEITVNEGDVLKLRVQTTSTGKVKVKQLCD